MMTSARPMAMRRSRVQTRISFRRECAVEGAGAGVSGTEGARGWFWSVLCIFWCLLFIAWGLWAAPDWIWAGRCIQVRRDRVTTARLAGREGEVEDSEGGDDGGFSAQDELPERGFLEPG